MSKNTDFSREIQLKRVDKGKCLRRTTSVGHLSAGISIREERNAVWTDSDSGAEQEAI